MANPSIRAARFLVGTLDGLFRARQEDREMRAQLIGLRGKGKIVGAIFDKKDPRRVLVATSAGLYRSEDGGQLWKDIGGIPSSNLPCITQHPRTGDIFVGTVSPLLYKTQTCGDAWSAVEVACVTSSLGSAAPITPMGPVRNIALHFANPNLIFVALKNVAVRSMDGGVSWSVLGLAPSLDISAIQPMSDNPAIVVCATPFGIHRSTDAGDTLQLVHKNANPLRALAFATHFSLPNAVFCIATDGSAQTALYRSGDQGTSWEKLDKAFPDNFAEVPTALALHPEDPQVIALGTVQGVVWISENGGSTFKRAIGGLAQVASISIQV